MWRCPMVSSVQDAPCGSCKKPSRRCRGPPPRWRSKPGPIRASASTSPGWRHGTHEYNSARRVAWDMRLDGSLVQAAQALQALQEKGECGNVFNGSLELGNCLPWFAPDAKHFMDSRLALYPGQAARFTKA